MDHTQIMSKLKNHFFSKRLQQFFFLCSFFSITGCSSTVFSSADQLFIQFSEHVDLIINLVNMGAVLVGVTFIFKALLKLKIYGEMRSMMAPHARLNQIFLLLFVGALLMSVPSATRSILEDALLGDRAIKGLAYMPSSHVTEEIQEAAKNIVRLIGSVALVRGLIQLGSYQEGGRHPLGKSFTHIIAGIFAINVQASINLFTGFLS